VKLAQAVLKVPDIIDSDELASGKLEDANMVLYLSLFYNAFKEKNAGDSRESLLRRLAELEAKFRQLTEENLALKNSKVTLESSQKDLQMKFSQSFETKSKALDTKSELDLSLKKLKETYASETKTLGNKIAQLTDEIALLKSSGDSSTTKLQNAKDAASKERDAVREELKKAKDQLTKEKEELMAHKEELEKSSARNKKLREDLETFKKTQQQNNEKCITILRGHLLQHVKDISLWRTLLEADRQFMEIGVKITTPDEIKGMPLNEQLRALDLAVVSDNKRLEKLVREKESEAAEVVSVNIGKKKKRIKKGDPMEAMHAAPETKKEPVAEVKSPAKKADTKAEPEKAVKGKAKK